MAAAAVETMPKGAFARLINVSPGRVSQMIKEGKISPDALEGEGRSAEIKVELALRQIGQRTDVGQRFGNGLATRLDPREQPPALEGLPAGESIDAKIRREKLRDLEIRNRNAAARELEGRGEYVRAVDVQAAFAAMAGGMVTVFEGALSDFAQALSARFELPSRDVLHLLRAEFVAVRGRAAEAMSRGAERLPIVLEDDRTEVS